MRIALVLNRDLLNEYESTSEDDAGGAVALTHGVNLIAKLAAKAEFLGVCNTTAREFYEAAATDTLISAGVPLTAKNKTDHRSVISLLEKWRVRYLVLITPGPEILNWADANRLRVLPIYDANPVQKGAAALIHNQRLKRVLNTNRMPVVGVQSADIGAALKKLGVGAEKLFPCRWPDQQGGGDNLQIDDNQNNAEPEVLLWGTLIERWIDSPRRPAQSIMRRSLHVRQST